MKAVHSCETLVTTYKTAWHHNPEHHDCLFVLLVSKFLFEELSLKSITEPEPFMIFTVVFISFQDRDEVTIGHSDRPINIKGTDHQNACSRMDLFSVGSTWHLGNSFDAVFP
jgi:hypothetical protein